MSCKWSLLGVHRFYNIEQAVELLTNMSDCEDESTSESENEGDSSDSSEYAPEQHQVRTDSNIQTVMPKETKYLKPKKYPKRDKKLHQNQLIIRVPQSVLYWLIKQPPHQVRNMLLHLQKYLKYLKPKKYPKKGQKSAPKLVDNQSVTNRSLLADQTATTSGEEHVASPPKVSKAKEISSQKAAPKLVDNQSATKAMVSNSDMDVEDYYIVEDDNESASSKYVPCVNYANDKVYPEDEKNGLVRLDQDTGPPIFIDLRDLVTST